MGFQDDVRNSHAVGGPAQVFLERIYPEPERLAKVIQADRDSYVSAESKITAKYLQKEDVGEPVGKVALRYFTSVDVQAAACELGLKDAKQLQAAIGVNRDLAVLGLGRLSQKPASSIQRVVWESVDGLSYWQEIMSVIHPGSMAIAPKSTNNSGK